MNHTPEENTTYKHLKQFYDTYPTALIDIVSEYYPLNMSKLDDFPVLNWQKISCNQNIRWDKWNFSNFKSKLDGSLLCRNNGFLDSPDFIEIIKENTSYFDLNSIIVNIGVTNFKNFFKEFVALKNSIDLNLIKNNYNVIRSPRLIRLVNKYIDLDEDKLNLRSWDQGLLKQEIENPDYKTTPSNYSINSVIFYKIKDVFVDTNDIDSIKCENTTELFKILANTIGIYNLKFNYRDYDLNKGEIEYLNNLPLDNELFIALVDLNEIFFTFFKYNKYLKWDESLFEELSDLNPWIYADELNGNYLTNDFIIKYSNRLNLSQKLFAKINWTMPVIFSMGWEDKFYRQFEIRRPGYDLNRRWDDIYIDFNLGNISNDVFIHYYPVLFKNYIESNLDLEMEVILSDLDQLKYLNKSLVNEFNKKLGNLISSTLTPEQIKLILEKPSIALISWYKLPRIAQFYCSDYTDAIRHSRSDSLYAPLSKFYPEIVSAFKKDQISPIFAHFFIKEQSIINYLSSEIINIKNAKIDNLEFIKAFNNLKSLLLTDCTLEDSESYEFNAATCLYISNCVLNTLNFVYSFKTINEFYFLSNDINSKENSLKDAYVRDVQSVYLENHPISEIRIDYSQAIKIGFSNIDSNILCEGIKFASQLTKLEFLIISRNYKFISSDKLREDISELDIFDLTVNQMISSCLNNLVINIKNLCLVNLIIDSSTLAANLIKNVNVLICQNYLCAIYEYQYGMPEYKSISNILYDSGKNTLDQYSFIVENKRFPDKIHWDLLYDEREDYEGGYEDEYNDEANFDAYTDGQYGNYYDSEGNGRGDIDPEILGL